MPTSLVATFVAVFAAGVVASAASHAAFVASPQFSSVDRELRRSSALLLQKLPVSKDDGDRTRGCAGNGAAVTSRRDALQAAAASSLSGALLLLLLLPLSPEPARAGIDPSALVNLPVEGDASGTATRLRQIEATRNRPEDAVDVPFVELPSGASYREYREGKGEAVVKEGSKVAVEMTARCRSFSTAQEPGGLKYFSTKDDTDFNELAWTVGSGALLPGLEEAMMGMHKGGLRRIKVPSTQVFAAKKQNQLPLPTTKDGKRRFENLFKTDATLLFEVLVTSIK